MVAEEGVTDRYRGTDGNGPAYGACLLAAAYAVVSFYWAFGGMVGIGTLGGRLEELGRQGDPAVLWLAGVAGVLKVAGAVLALALVRPWGRVVPRWLLLGVARAGAAGRVGGGGGGGGGGGAGGIWSAERGRWRAGAGRGG